MEEQGLERETGRTLVGRQRRWWGGRSSLSCLTFGHRLKSNNQKAFEVKWAVTMKSNLLEIKSINQTLCSI